MCWYWVRAARVILARLAVIGGGHIGAETASMLDHLGVDATILESTNQLLPGADPELRAYLTRNLSGRINVLLDAAVVAIERAGDDLRVRYRRADQESALNADAVLMATGRESAVPEGIDRLGLPARGPLAVDATMRTIVDHVYAPGDVNGRSMLFHSAVRQSMVAAHNILAGGQAVDRMNFHGVPFTVFTDPEIAWVGLDESTARAAGLDVAVARYDYATDSRAQIAGMDAAQVIAPLALAVQARQTARGLAQTAFPHPMITEGISKAARKFQP